MALGKLESGARLDMAAGEGGTAADTWAMAGRDSGDCGSKSRTQQLRNCYFVRNSRADHADVVDLAVDDREQRECVDMRERTEAAIKTRTEESSDSEAKEHRRRVGDGGCGDGDGWWSWSWRIGSDVGVIC